MALPIDRAREAEFDAAARRVGRMRDFLCDERGAAMTDAKWDLYWSMYRDRAKRCGWSCSEQFEMVFEIFERGWRR